MLPEQTLSRRLRLSPKQLTAARTALQARREE
jgi:hypothetical protein